jgi:hypothetical protein
MPEVEVQDAPLFMSDQFQGEGFSYQFNMSKVKKEKRSEKCANVHFQLPWSAELINLLKGKVLQMNRSQM